MFHSPSTVPDPEGERPVRRESRRGCPEGAECHRPYAFLDADADGRSGGCHGPSRQIRKDRPRHRHLSGNPQCLAYDFQKKEEDQSLQGGQRGLPAGKGAGGRNRGPGQRRPVQGAYRRSWHQKAHAPEHRLCPLHRPSHRRDGL